MAAFCFDAVLGVKVIHSNERVAETIWWHRYFHKMGKILFNRLGALSAFGRAISTFFSIVWRCGECGEIGGVQKVLSTSRGEDVMQCSTS